VLDHRDENDPATKWAWLVYDVAALDNGLGDGEPQFAPPGYADESAYEKFAVYVADGPGRVALTVYYAAALKDFWVVGSPASKAEAVAKGYALVGTIGYALASNTTSGASR
jgi:hypothetical protein